MSPCSLSPGCRCQLSLDRRRGKCFFLGKGRKIAEVSHLPERSVKFAFKQLVEHHVIERKPGRRNDAGKFGAGRVHLINPQTGKRLSTDPGRYGLLSSNVTDDYFSFITVPRPSLEEIHTMKHASEKAVYLAALCLVSKAMDECVFVDRSLWQELAHLGKNAFNRGVRYCIGRKLLSYRKHVLTLHDPQTGKPTERWKNKGVRVEHENAHWKYDLDKFSSEEWRIVLEKLLHESITSFDGWRTLQKIRCPFCGERGSFSMSMSTSSGFRCHGSGCRVHGKLGQLVQRVRGTNMDAAKVFIQETIEQNRIKEIAA